MPASYSVVINAYNEEEWIADAIHSVLLQTVPHLELIVVDDGSRDGTVEQVRRFADDPRVRLIEQPNAGPSAARNTGIAAATAEWVSFLDSDDLWMPSYLERVGGALAGRPEADIAYVEAWRLDVGGRFFRAPALARQNPPEDPPTDATEFLRLLIDRGNFVFVSTTVRRSVLEEVGGWRADLRSCEDFDLWIRILAAGHDIVHPSGRLAIKRDRPTGLSANEAKVLKDLRDVYRLVEREYDVPEDVRGNAGRYADELEGPIAAIDSGSSARRLKVRARVALGSAWRSLRRRSVFYEETPAEIRAAFPDLDI
jgi:glycosyltransferase involved in cell wall biosynthesis